MTTAALKEIMIDEALTQRFDELREKVESAVDETLFKPGVRMPGIVRTYALAGRAYIPPEQAFNQAEVDELRRALTKAVEGV